MERTQLAARISDMLPTSRAHAVQQKILSRSSSGLSSLEMVWLSAARWTVAMARRAYPIVLVFALCAAAIAATIAIRLAIWLPMYLH